MDFSSDETIGYRFNYTFWCETRSHVDEWKQYVVSSVANRFSELNVEELHQRMQSQHKKLQHLVSKICKYRQSLIKEAFVDVEIYTSR